jgi:hypothetical protein
MWKSKLEFNPILKMETGKVIEGIYRGSRKVDKIDSVLHTVEVDGIVYDLYGCGSLDAQLKEIAPDSRIKVLYSGKKMATVKIGNKPVKKEVHNYVVYTWQKEE